MASSLHVESLKSEITPYAALDNGRNSMFRVSLYPSYTAIDKVLEILCNRFGGGSTRLANLLGATPQATVNWRKGRGRPSPLFLMRAIQLLEWQTKGLDLMAIQQIDWDIGMVRLRRPLIVKEA
jgi:hypothetical protein